MNYLKLNKMKTTTARTNETPFQNINGLRSINGGSVLFRNALFG